MTTMSRRNLLKAAVVTAGGIYAAPFIETSVAEGAVVSTTCCACYGVDPGGTYPPYATGVYSIIGTAVDCNAVCEDAENAVPGASLKFWTTKPKTLGFSSTTADPHPGCSYRVSAWDVDWLKPLIEDDSHGNPHVWCPPNRPAGVECLKKTHGGYDGS